MEKPEITLIIPMYNESKIIAETAIVLNNYMKENFNTYEKQLDLYTTLTEINY